MYSLFLDKTSSAALTCVVVLAWQVLTHSSRLLCFFQVGFDSVHFARIDYQDRAKRMVDKSLEVVWRGSKTFGSSSQVYQTHQIYSPTIPFFLTCCCKYTYFCTCCSLEDLCKRLPCTLQSSSWFSLRSERQHQYYSGLMFVNERLLEILGNIRLN